MSSEISHLDTGRLPRMLEDWMGEFTEEEKEIFLKYGRDEVLLFHHSVLGMGRAYKLPKILCFSNLTERKNPNTTLEIPDIEIISRQQLAIERMKKLYQKYGEGKLVFFKKDTPVM